MVQRLVVRYAIGLLILTASLSLGRSSAWAYRTTGNQIVEARIVKAISSGGIADIIVWFSQGVDLSAAEDMDWVSRGEYVYRTLLVQAEQDQGGAIAYVKSRGMDYRSYFSSNALYVFEADRKAITALANLPEVSRISAPQVHNLVGWSTDANPSMPLTLFASGQVVDVNLGTPEQLSWAVSDTQADAFWGLYGAAGEGIIVASIDTGVQWDHAALIDSYKCPLNPGDPACWYDPGGECTGDPCDTNGNGTATMGPITGENDLSVPHQVGMAPEAQWIACLGCPNGSCPDYELLACADWVLAPNGNPANRPHLVNNAWGSFEICGNFFLTPILNWQAAGIAATFAAGGGEPGCGTIRSPADHFEVFTSTAHDSNRLIWGFSPTGPSSCAGGDLFVKPNISAPGVDIWLPTSPDGWGEWSGTSFSNSYGSGALVLLMSCSPGMIGNVYALFDAIQDSADPPPDGYCEAPPSGDGNFTYGHGYINMLTTGEIFCGATGWLEGVVTDQESGYPLDGALITATLTSDPLKQRTTSTNGGGYYNLMLQVGTYDLEAAYPGYETGIAIVEILTDTFNIQDFALVPEDLAMGGIEGVVLDQRDDTPLAGALITATLLSDPLTWAAAMTDGSGYYSFTLEVGLYDLLTTFPEFLPGSATVEVLNGSVTTQDFILEWNGAWITALPIILKN